MELIVKEQLDKEYVAFGRFYGLKYKNMKTKKCRSILEIYERESCCNLRGTNKIDAVFVMMNPGSGKPKISCNQKPVSISEVKKGVLEEIQLVEADPDDTQYQVMRVMKEKEWKYVRVINLSDYKEAKSKDFYDIIKEALTFDSECIHSIFSEYRTEELKDVFKSEGDFKVVSAWGVNTKLCSLIKLALTNSNLEKRIGYNKAKYKNKKYFYYYHPLQRGQSRQANWLEELLKRV